MPSTALHDTCLAMREFTYVNYVQSKNMGFFFIIPMYIYIFVFISLFSCTVYTIYIILNQTKSLSADHLHITRSFTFSDLNLVTWLSVCFVSGWGKAEECRGANTLYTKGPELSTKSLFAEWKNNRQREKRTSLLLLQLSPGSANITSGKRFG